MRKRLRISRLFVARRVVVQRTHVAYRRSPTRRPPSSAAPLPSCVPSPSLSRPHDPPTPISYFKEHRSKPWRHGTHRFFIGILPATRTRTRARSQQRAADPGPGRFLYYKRTFYKRTFIYIYINSLLSFFLARHMKFVCLSGRSSSSFGCSIRKPKTASRKPQAARRRKIPRIHNQHTAEYRTVISTGGRSCRYRRQTFCL